MMKSEYFRMRWLVLGIFFISCVGGWLCMDAGHEWGDDFILYLHQARCWIRGGMQELSVSNQACMDQSDGIIGPYLYPQGFPVLMSLPMRGIDIWGLMGLKIFNYSIFIVCMVSVYRWFRLLFEDRMVPTVLSLILVVWHPKIWEAANRLTSDLWFAGLAGVFMFLLYASWRNNIAKNITLGLLVFMATSTRTNGVFLVVPWVILIWQENPRFYVGGRANVNLLLAVIWGGLCALLALKNDLGHGPVYVHILKSVTPVQVFLNMGLYLKMIGTYPLWHFSTFIGAALGSWATILLSAGVWALIALAVAKRGWQLLPVVSFVILNLALFCAWPSLQGVRLLFVIFPMIAVLVVVGLMELWHMTKPLIEARIALRALRKSSSWAIALSVIVLIQGLATALHYVVKDTNEAFSKEITEVYSFVETSVKPGERISFHKPRLMRYVTGVETYKIATEYGKNTQGTDEAVSGGMGLNEAIQKLRENQIDYWVLSKEQLGRADKPVLPIAYENDGFMVYEVLSKKDHSTTR